MPYTKTDTDPITQGDLKEYNNTYVAPYIGGGGGGSGGGHVILDENGDELTQRDTLAPQLPLYAEDNSTDEVTELSVDTDVNVDFSDFEVPIADKNNSAIPLDITSATNDDFLKFNGTDWVNVTQEDVLKALNHYSTTERVVGMWYDGRPVYEKIIEFTTAGRTSGTFDSTIIMNIGGSQVTEYERHISLPNNIALLVFCDGFIEGSFGQIPIVVFYNNSQLSNFWWNKETNKIQHRNVGYYETSARIIIKYVKTTDTPIS